MILIMKNSDWIIHGTLALISVSATLVQLAVYTNFSLKVDSFKSLNCIEVLNRNYNCDKKIIRYNNFRDLEEIRNLTSELKSLNLCKELSAELFSL